MAQWLAHGITVSATRVRFPREAMFFVLFSILHRQTLFHFGPNNGPNFLFFLPHILKGHIFQLFTNIFLFFIANTVILSFLMIAIYFLFFSFFYTKKQDLPIK